MNEELEQRFPRYDFSLLPWVFSLQMPASWEEPKPLRLAAQNISKGGIKFLSNRRIPLFEDALVIFYAKNDGKEVFRIKGKVIRLEEIDTGYGEKTYGIALEFHPQDGAELSAMLETYPAALL